MKIALFMICVMFGLGEKCLKKTFVTWSLTVINMKTILKAGLICALVCVEPLAQASAMPLAPAATTLAASEQATPGDGEIVLAQFRRGGGGFRGPVRRGGRWGGGGGGGAGTGAAAAIIGLGILGAIAANQAARARPRCWVESRRMFNRYGDYIGVRRVRVCR